MESHNNTKCSRRKKVLAIQSFIRTRVAQSSYVSLSISLEDFFSTKINCNATNTSGPESVAWAGIEGILFSAAQCAADCRTRDYVKCHQAHWQWRWRWQQCNVAIVCVCEWNVSTDKHRTKTKLHKWKSEYKRISTLNCHIAWYVCLCGIYHLRPSVLLRFLLLFIHFNFVYILKNKLGTNTWRAPPSATCEIVAQIKFASRKYCYLLWWADGASSELIMPRTQPPCNSAISKTNENFYLCIFSLLPVARARALVAAGHARHIYEFELIRLLSSSVACSHRTHHNKHHNVLRDTSVLLLFTLTRFATTLCMRMPHFPLARTSIHVFRRVCAAAAVK